MKKAPEWSPINSIEMMKSTSLQSKAMRIHLQKFKTGIVLTKTQFLLKVVKSPPMNFPNGNSRNC